MNINKLVVCDVECYTNYFLIMFKKVVGGDVLYFEKFNGSALNRKNILHILNKYTLVTFNGIKYDIPVIEAAIAGMSNESLYKIGNMIIQENKQPWQIRKQFGFAALDIDHIDLIEVAPLKASLKIYGGRLHCQKMQDLPIEHYETIKEKDVPILRTYCLNDLDVTILLLKELEQAIELREAMGKRYNVDVRSKSDAQIAEQVIKQELKDVYNINPKRPEITTGTIYHYKPPKNISFETELLRGILHEYKTLPFIVQKSGHVALPEELKGRKFVIGGTTYKIGVGGLHSCEKKVYHTSENCILRDYDVAAYYPNIILNNRLYPKHIGEPFLKIYKGIVERRLKAKKEGNKVINESLKITINGSFGKLGSKWSAIYSPDLMMQVTVTGQLSLLMLIERLELAGISVVSANTDGIVIKCCYSLEPILKEITEEWQFDTKYELEVNNYISLNSRDVNNYIAVKEEGIKGKGAYADQSDIFYKLRSNPVNRISVEAAKLYLQDKVPIEKTVKNCNDITKFITVRTVNGGAIKEGRFLGKAIRWYYGSEELDAIYYKTNGNKVPRSDFAVPLMELPNKLPKDIDYNWYIEEAKNILKDVGHKKL